MRMILCGSEGDGMHPFSSADDNANALHPAQARTEDYSGRSNLALAFLCLAREKRADMNVFYTFCRVVDDIADSPALPPEDKAALLNSWRNLIHRASDLTVAASRSSDSPLLADGLRNLILRYQLNQEYLLDIITGVEMDLTGRRYDSFEQLRVYCYRVASVVGLVSIEIFGYHDEETKQYAVDLGLALQLTNIIRDVAVDLDNGGRIYLPLEDLERFGYTPADLRSRVYDKRFQALMAFEAKRAEDFYRSALAHLHPVDRRSMVAAEIMRAIYWRLLRTIQRGRYRVFERRFRLNTPHKLLVMLGVVLRNRWK